MGKRSAAFGWFFALVWIAVPLYGQEPDDGREPQDAQPQFDALAVQGEYAGELTKQGQTYKAGAQVVALGDNRFSIAIYQGGLPGAGYEPPGRVERESRTEDGKLVFGAVFQFEYDAGVLHAKGPDFSGQLKRVERTSETLGQTPPEGARVLFDGTSGDQFEARDGGDPVIDGVLRQGIISKQRFGDCRLHMEFRLPFEPTRSGQARGNSGIYVQGRYEVQMLDSFGLSGEHNECGGIYSIRKPDVNMCYPPETWQTYDIDFTAARWNEAGEKTDNARMSVRHNGVVIHYDVELPKTTTAAPLKETADPGYLYLQDHGSPVRYRNIWVIEK